MVRASSASATGSAKLAGRLPSGGYRRGIATVGGADTRKLSFPNDRRRPTVSVDDRPLRDVWMTDCYRDVGLQASRIRAVWLTLETSALSPRLTDEALRCSM